MFDNIKSLFDSFSAWLDALTVIAVLKLMWETIPSGFTGFISTALVVCVFISIVCIIIALL